MKALHAGYVSGAVWKVIRDEKLSPELDWQDILTQLCHFVIDRDVGGEGVLPPELAVLENIICRGLPTLPSLHVEKKLEQLTGLTKNGIIGNKDVATYSSDFNPAFAQNLPSILTLLERSFCMVSPEAFLEASTGFSIPEFGSGDDNTDFDSQAERVFWNGPLAELLGRGGMQIVVKQRSMSTIAGDGFIGQRVDFSVQFPGSKKGIAPKGLIFEVDGPTHATAATQGGDKRRDEACKRAGWEETYRHRLWRNVQASAPLDKNHPGVAGVLRSPYLRRLNQNVKKPLVNGQLDSRVNILALFPLAVARIQRVLLELVRGGFLSVDAPEWDLVVLDRDGLPGCGVTAAHDLQLWLGKLWAIYRPGFSVPIIRVHEISQQDPDAILPDRADVLLDISVQLRYGVSLPTPPGLQALKGVPSVIIRSDYFTSNPYHHLTFGDPLVPKVNGDKIYHELTFFLQNIFRKVAFRPKQTEIIMRALRGESVIALLPTGAGKSITYQIPTLLQNGMTIVVDPIKSLMKDQDDNLKAIGISSSAFINSMTTAKERRHNTELMQQGCFKFVFVSPERFIIREFRDALNQMRSQSRVHFAYAVTDEAHCVSEWGHDFRTAYLRLGANARKFCSTRWLQLPILALTGTASFEVLDDVRVELGYKTNSDIDVRPESMERKNLNYRVVSLEPQPVIPANADEMNIKQIIGDAKLGQLPGIVTDMTQSLTGFDVSSFINMDKGSGLVFCPHARWVHGAEKAREALSKEFDKVKERFGVYYGSPEEKAGIAAFDPIQTQNDFKRGTLKVLACTKAFGMGIDKPDIRFTLHYNIPPSLESFYQEAGRAGRDGDDSQCWILYAGTKMPGKNHSLDYSLNYDFHSNTFPGADIEEAKVFEILDENRSPGHSALNDIANMLLDEMDIEFTVGLWPVPNSDKYRIYINHPDHRDAKVFIELTPGNISSGNKNPYPDHAKVTQLVGDWLNKNKPANNSWGGWLLSEGDVTISEGIEELLDRKTGSICLSFENAYLEKIAARIKADLKDVRDAYKYADDVEEFVGRLAGKSMISKAMKEQIKSVFPKIRLREHTFRALYRLTILGAVDDFEADYAGATITATLRPLARGIYREHLREYIHRYAPMDVEHYLTVADQCDYATELRCCLHALIQFVYARIAKQRVEALNIMEQTTVQGITDDKAFAEAVTNFFDSAYLPTLRPYLNEYTSELVFEICRDTGASDAKLSHLLGACNRLLPENPENAAFHALRAYAIALLGYRDQDVMDEITAAIIAFEKYQDWGRREKLLFLMRLRGQIAAVNLSRARAFDATIVNDHAKWLKSFNSEADGFQEQSLTKEQQMKLW